MTIDVMETVTTVPLVRPDATGEERYPFWDAVLEHTGNHPHLAAKPRTDPWWAVALVFLGAGASVFAGSFIIGLQVFS